MTTFIHLKKPKPPTQAEQLMIDNYEETLNKIKILNSKMREPKPAKKTKTEKAQETNSKIKQALAAQFNAILNQAAADVTGSKLDNEGKLFGVSPIGDKLGRLDKLQGAQGEQVSKTEAIFNEDNRLKKKVKDKNKMETVWNDGQTDSNEDKESLEQQNVKWANSVVNKFSQQGRRGTGNPSVEQLLTFEKKPGTGSELKSTTEINLIIQQRLGHASVDQLLSRRELHPAQIAKELVNQQKTKQVALSKKFNKNEKFLPKTRTVRKISNEKTAVMHIEHKTKSPKQSTIESLPSIIVVNQPERKQNFSLSNTANRSSLKKRPDGQPTDLHYGLQKYERAYEKGSHYPGDLSVQSQLHFQSSKANMYRSDYNYEQQYASAQQLSPRQNQMKGNSGIQSSPSTRSMRRICEGEYSSHLKQSTVPRQGAYKKLQDAKNKPIVRSAVFSQPLSKKANNKSSLNVSTDLIERQPITVASPQSRSVNSIPARMEQSTKDKTKGVSVTISPKTRNEKHNRSPHARYEQHDRHHEPEISKTPLLPKINEKSIKKNSGQAALFAEFAGLDQITDEQGKDERHGRVVRDYQMLQENKEKMRSLIGLLAQEHEEVATVQRKLKLAQIAPNMWFGGSKLTNEMQIQSNAETPRTMTETNLNLHRDTNMVKSKQFHRSSRVMAQTQQPHDKKQDSNGFESAKLNKITPFEFSRDDISAETLKLDKNDRTILQPKNFKYFLMNPHIYFGIDKKHSNNLKTDEYRSAQHQDRRKLGNNNNNQLRPTSFDGMRQQDKMIFPDHMSQDFNKDNSRDKIARDTVHTSQLLRPNQHASELFQFKKPQNIRDQRASEYKPGYSDMRQAYGSDTEYLGDTTSIHDDEFYKSISVYPMEEGVFLEHGRNKSEVVFALSSNMAGLKIPQRQRLNQEDLNFLQKGDAEKDIDNQKNGAGKSIPFMEVKARVDSNNPAGRNILGNGLIPHALTFVLKKGRAKPSINYICDNLYTYAEPLFGHISKQQTAGQKGLAEQKPKSNKGKLGSRVMSPLHTSSNLNGSTAATSAVLPQSLNTKHPNGTPPSASIKRRKKTMKSTQDDTDSKQGSDRPKGKKKTKKKQGVERYKDKVIVGVGRKENDDEAIMEMSEEEYEDASSRDRQPAEQTWQEMFYENEALKQQIASQIAIFEQYLKVALLQQRQKEIEIRRGNIKYQKGIFEGAEVVLDRHSGSLIEEETLTLNDAKEERLRVQQRNQEAKSKFYLNQKMGKQLQKSKESEDEEDLEDSKVERFIKGTKNSAGHTNRKRSQSPNSEKSQGGKNASHKRLKGSNSNYTKEGRGKRIESLQNSEKKGARPGPAQKIIGFVQRLAGGIIAPKLGVYGYNLQPDAHVTHQVWLDKIEKLWKKLERYRNSECVNVQIQIDQNKKRLFDLTRQNVFELEVQTHDQKMLLRAKFNAKKMQQAIAQTKEERQLRKVQKKLRRAIKTSEELGTWGLNNYVISLQIKCRMTEDIVDLAQKLQLKPDKDLEEKMERLKRLRVQVYQDLYYFITEREKVHWRNWDHAFMGNFKPDIPPRRNMLAFYREKIDNTLLQIEFLELKSLELQDDINGFNKMNSQNIVTVTQQFGHDHWLHFWQIRQLRRKQMNQVFAFDPSKQFLQSLSDPLDHIKYMQQQNKQNFEMKYLTPPPEVQETASEKARRVVKFSDEIQPPTAKQVTENVHVMALDIDDKDEDANKEVESKGQDTQVQSGAMSEEELSEEEKKSQASDGSLKKEKFVPKWTMQIEKSKREKEAKEKAEKEARIARLQKLIDDTEFDYGLAEVLDKFAVERKMQDYLGKINTHLQVELQLLDAWRHPDEIKEDENENLDNNESNIVRDMKKK